MPRTDEDGDAVRLRQDMLDAETIGDHGEEALGHGELNLVRCSPHVLIPDVRRHRHHAKCGRTKLHSAFRVCPERLFPDEAPEHQTDHSDADEGNGGAEVLLVMAYEAAAAREP